jgi:hypothetical protein
LVVADTPARLLSLNWGAYLNVCTCVEACLESVQPSRYMGPALLIGLEPTRMGPYFPSINASDLGGTCRCPETGLHT